MAPTIHAEPAACPDDEALLRFVEGALRDEALDAVDAHLDHCALCREVVAALGASSRDALSGPRERTRVPERAERIGRFLVLEPIGEGAMGVVWAAYDPELDRRVAIKLLHAHRDGAKGRARLAREARAMAKLSHPNVVTVYDVGVHDDAVYVAMELVEGTSVRAWLEAAPRSSAEVLEVFRQAGAGLAAAHDAGLVHRDFKPENVFVDRVGRAKVGDFGLARAESDEDARGDDAGLGVGTSLTRTGALLGTPAYMAPEQLAGEAAGAAADQFGFCVALWEALTGARPFAGATTIDALRAQIAAGPSAAPASIPPRVAQALMRGLAPRAEDRFPDLRALLEALTPEPVARGRTARNVIAVAVLLAVAGTAIAVAAVVTAPSKSPCGTAETLRSGLWSSEARARLHAAAPGATPSLDAFARRWAAGRVDACEATHLRHEQSEARLDERVRCLDRARSAFGAVCEVLQDGSTFAEAEILAALPDPQICASLDGRVAPPPARDRARVEAARGAIDEARVELAAARERARSLAEGLVVRAESIAYPPLVAEARLLRASSRAADARHDDALDDAHVALFAAEAFGDDRTAAEAWLTLVRIAGTAGRYSEAAQHARHAQAAIARAGTPPDMAETLHRLRGMVRTNLGALDDAEADLRAAMGEATQRVGADSAELAPIHTALGNLARLDGHFDVALAEHQRALALDRAAWGEEHPRVARDLHNVAGVLRHLDRRVEARAHYLEALAIERRRLGEAHPDFGLTSNSLGLLAFDAGDDAEARARWESARAIFEANGHEDLALVRYNLALLELRQGHDAPAVEHARAAIAIDERRLGQGAKRVGAEHLALGRALLRAGHVAEAHAALERAQTIARTLGDVELEADATARLDALPVERVARPVAHGAPHTPQSRAAASAVPPPAVVAAPTPPPPAVAAPRPPVVQRRTGSAGYAPGQAWE